MIKSDIEGPYILWVKSDYAYSPQSFSSIEEALKIEKYTSDWIITKEVKYEIIEKPEISTRQFDQMNIKFEKILEERK